MTWDEYCEQGVYFRKPAYEKHLERAQDGAVRGFATATGKIELTSEFLPALGGERLPDQGAPLRLCSPELVERARAEGGAHLPLITGARKQPYNASMYLENPEFRRRSPHPVAEVSILMSNGPSC